MGKKTVQKPSKLKNLLIRSHLIDAIATRAQHNRCLENPYLFKYMSKRLASNYANYKGCIGGWACKCVSHIRIINTQMQNH